jgi:small multidrug resistance pump
MKVWLQLAAGIGSEVIATSALKHADGFTRVWPSLLAIAGYAAAFYFLSLSLRGIPLGVAYAIWSGIGLPLIALSGWALYRQSLDLPALIGIALVAAGVVVIGVFSQSVRQ